MDIAVVDAVTLCNPLEIGVGGPYIAFVVLRHEQPNRPIQSGIVTIDGNEILSEPEAPSSVKAILINLKFRTLI